MRATLAATALILFVSSVCVHADLSQKYARGPIALKKGAALHYSVDKDAKTISFALVITAPELNDGSRSAWAGLGISEATSGSMLGADIASVQFIGNQLAKCTLKDRYVPFAAFPLRKEANNARGVYPREDKCQNDGSWKLINCERDPRKNTLIMEVSRSLKAHDDQDREITHGPQQFIYAYGAGGFIYHGPRRAGTRITFFEKDYSIPKSLEEELPKDIVSTQTLLATSYKVPSDVITTYACTSFVLNIPKGQSLTLVAMEPVIKSVKGKNKVHHLVVSACPQTAAHGTFVNTKKCDKNESAMKCKDLLYAWAVGGSRFVMPKDVGLEITEEHKYVYINTHYDNPEQEEGAIDMSGARLYFAKSRPIKAGSVTLGDAAVSLMKRTVQHEKKYVSTCPSECTGKFKKPINVFGSFMHMHQVGRKIYTNRFAKDGTFLNDINTIEYWSNDHQFIRKFNPPKVINPGDKLSTTCIYDTRKKPNVKFGLETTDEMCMEFLFYYPLQKLLPTDGTSAFCGMYQPGGPNSTDPAITLCGGNGRKAALKMVNPSFKDTKGTPDIFGRKPKVCVVASSKGTSTPTSTPPGRTASAGNANSNNGVCFPGAATVLLKDGTLRRMEDLQLGDEVHVGNGMFSKVFAFTHKLRDTVNHFVTLTTASGTISLTPSHLIYSNGALVPARNVRVGDALRTADGTTVRVQRVSGGAMRGLYNPQTLHGDIVVDGVVASTYTTEVNAQAAHALLAPLRCAAQWARMYTTAFDKGMDNSEMWRWMRPAFAA